MSPKKDQVQPVKPATPARSRRFRIDKLEERIAPSRGGKGTNNCPTTNCGDGSSFSSY